MGWSTELFCNLSFNRETFNYKSEVRDKMEEYEKYLQHAKNRLRDLALMTEPAKFCREEEDPLMWIRSEYEDAMELIEEYTIELYKLGILLDNWDNCHNEKGLAKDPPEGIGWNTAFLHGDFVASEKYPNPNEL